MATLRVEMGTLPEALGQMCAVPFEDSCTERGPDQSFGDVGLGGIEGVQTRIALPLFEHQLYLPAQPIRITNLLEGEIRTRKIGNKIARSFVLCVPGPIKRASSSPLP